jgi:hypothetical protein
MWETLLQWVLIFFGVCALLWSAGRLARKGKAAVVVRKTRLVGADTFKAQAQLIRSINIRGSLRSGKTKLGYVLGKEFIEEKISVGGIANIPTRWKLPPEWWFLNDCVVMYDEAWALLDNRSSLSNPRQFSAFAGKTRTIWIYPSVIALDKRQSMLWAEAIGRIVFPGLKPLIRWLRQVPIVGGLIGLTPLDWFGDTVVRYTWGLEMGYRVDKGSFLMIYPDEVNWEYASFWSPTSDGGITEAWERSLAVAVLEQNTTVKEFLDDTWLELGGLEEYESLLKRIEGQITTVRNIGSGLRQNSGGSAA